MNGFVRGVVTASALCVSLSAAADVFVNEVNYDNTGTDTGEAIEVVATGGENLAQYSIVLYNGANGQSYSTTTVPAGSSTTACGGSVTFGVLNYASNGIQNGNPDGIALIGPSGVIQFLSYGGTFAAVNGPATGLTSVDIGVTDPGTDPIGQSLQLGGGPSSTYGGFAWNGSAASTFGACNNGQTFGAAVDNPPQLTSNVPDQGDVDVPVSTAITLNFSEPVTTAPDPWFVLDCGGPVAATASGTGASRTITPNASLPFATLCTVTLTAANINDTDGTPQPLSGTSSFSFTTAADLAPTVQSIVPAHNATGVAVNTSITINFSEPVSATGNWVALSCTISGSHAGTISGGPSTWTFDPGVDLQPGDACTTTLTAASISDLDGTPQTLAGQSTFAFSVAPDNAPTVTSSFPSDGAVNVAVSSNLTVTFSEPVTATASAFSVDCGATHHTATQTSGDQITWTLNPDSDFAQNVACTLTISATQVQDIDGTPNPMAADVVIDFVTSAGATGYYARVDDFSCRGLRAKVHGVIDDHTSYPYSASSTDTFDLLEDVDEDPGDATHTHVLDVYRNRKYLKGTDRSGNTGPTTFNREHTWPKSLGFPSETGDLGLPNAPHTDIHMLYASASDYNSTRSNNPYRDCASAGSCSEQGTDVNYGNGGGSGFPGQSNWNGGSYYHVWSKRKGDVARAVLYMDVRYEGGTNSKTGQSEPDLVLTYGSDSGTPGSLDTLLAWHNVDPPATPSSSNLLDNLEPVRNDKVQLWQGNRNPLIDHPEWAPILFANPCTGPDVIAVDDDFTVAQNGSLTVASPGVLRDDRNGVNKNGQGLTASLVGQAAHGTVTLTNATSGAFTYQPTSGFCGDDQFTYQVTNGSATDQGIAHIVVTCTSPDIAPTAVSDAFTVNEDSGTTTLTVLANDTDPDGGPKFVQAVTQPTGATVAIGAGGVDVTFTPNTNFCGSTSFSYTLNGSSQTTVTMTVTCIDDAPVAVADSATVAQDSSGNIVDVLANDTDVDGGAKLVTTVGAPLHGSATVGVGGANITYTPSAGYCGTDSVSYTITGGSNATISIDVTCTIDAVFQNGFE